MENITELTSTNHKEFKSQTNVKDYTDYSSVNEQIWRPYKYMTSVPGKNVKINLVEVLGHWMTDVPKDILEKISEIIQCCHNGSLLIDDIQDDSILRRGVPTAHTIFGIANTVNAADYLLFGDTVLKVLELNRAEAIRIYFDAALLTIYGQGMELYWRDNFICPTEEEYMDMINKKTGTFFVLGKELMKLFSTLGKDVDKFLTAFGQYFQIMDDYNSLNNKFYFESKGVFCEDISEGKFGFPTVHAINNNPDIGIVLIDILRKRTLDVELKKRYLCLLEECGSFEYTRNKINELTDIIGEEAETLGENIVFKDFLAKLPYFSL